MCGNPRLFTGSTGIFLKSSEAFFFFFFFKSKIMG